MQDVKVLYFLIRDAKEVQTQTVAGVSVTSYPNVERVLAEYLKQGYEIKSMSGSGAYFTFVLEKP